jgi:hypothetical protein
MPRPKNINKLLELSISAVQQTEVMSTTRLTFLYPHLFRAAKVGEPVSQTLRVRTKPARQRCFSARGFATTGPRRERLVERHGKAVEPFLVKGETGESFKVFTPEPEEKEDQKPEKPASHQEKLDKEAQEDESESIEEGPPSSSPLSAETQAAAFIPGDTESDVPPGKTDLGAAEELTPLRKAAVNTANPLAPLETVLQMPPPETQAEANEAKPPHLQAPPYIHHFDTYTLVQQVEGGGFTVDQSITAMKAVRGLLAVNLDLAKAGLVSKSDVENVSVLCVDCVTNFIVTKNGRKRTCSAQHALSYERMSRINARPMMKICEGNGLFCSTKSIS